MKIGFCPGGTTPKKARSRPLRYEKEYLTEKMQSIRIFLFLNDKADCNDGKNHFRDPIKHQTDVVSRKRCIMQSQKIYVN